MDHGDSPSKHTEAGFSLVELLGATFVFVLTALLGASYVLRSSSELTQAKNAAFARQKALAIIAEVRLRALRSEFETAADLDVLDDGGSVHPTLTVMTDPDTGLPVVTEIVPGCAFAERCSEATAQCREERPVLIAPPGDDVPIDREVACWHAA